MFGHLVTVVAVLTCLWLGDWQWFRAETTGSVQNWGYALQWPLFAVCFVVGWWRMLLLESRRLDDLEAEAAAPSVAVESPVENLASSVEDAAHSVDNASGPVGKPAAPVNNSGTAVDPAADAVGKTAGSVEKPAEPVEKPAEPVEKPAEQVENGVAPGRPNVAPGRADVSSAGDAEDPEDAALAAYNRMLRELAERDAASRR
ncbi:hypothetical protein GCM10023321_64100 [Pseudonocardia eucalypti]|uniref:DNA-binding transcriptional regulator of glucitol operon n=2 Tax=Pseudonocardia eucalypti TaxID=648755 RepID=A0ABP9QXS0_9PSEU